MAMSSLRVVKNDVETIKLLMPPEPKPPTCGGCGSQHSSERGDPDEGCYFCDRCFEKMVPAGIDEFLENLPRDKNGVRMACGGGAA